MQDTASYLGLEQDLQHITALEGLLISVMPDCLLFDAYFSQKKEWNTEDLASEFGELFKKNERLFQLLGGTSESQITIENEASIIVIRNVSGLFVLGMIFDVRTPLALVRVHAEQIAKLCEEKLASIEVSEVQESFSSAVKVLEYLKEYAPDPHTSLMRIALKTGIPLGVLNQPQQLDHEQTKLIEQAVCEVLGLDELVL